MEFALTDEQQELASTVRALLDKRADSAAVRSAIQGEPGYHESLWQTMCEQIGVAALVVPEEHDGVGASLFETAVVLEELGRSLAPSPLLASTIAAAALLLHGSDEQRADLLPRIAGGTLATAVLDPPLVLEPAAELVLIPRGDALEVSDDRPESRPALDPTIRLGHLDTGAEPSPPLRDVATALVTALQLGCARRGLDMTVAYAQERVQFGRPIGSFQALKHRMADLLVLLEMIRSASWAATGAASSYLQSPTVERAATLHERATVAKAYCGDALDRIASETIQLHGGIAITWEHDAHLVFKRAHALGQLFGTASSHRADVARWLA
jgi:alkylation response protein AidB-like acyl-CoA dehydrogenase